jgi:hypothetical protein
MSQAQKLIAVFHDLNRSTDRTVAHFTPSLIGMFGSLSIFDAFLSEIDAAVAKAAISASLKKRAANLSGTFIPQVAEYNGIADPSALLVTDEQLRKISLDSLENRKLGTVIILSALMLIMKEAAIIELHQASS